MGDLVGLLMLIFLLYIVIKFISIGVFVYLIIFLLLGSYFGYVLLFKKKRKRDKNGKS